MKNLERKMTLFPGKKTKKSKSGFSIIEVLIALALIASITAMLAGFLGTNPVSLMREEAFRLTRIIRYCYFQAATRNQYYRIVFDLGESSYHVEFSEDPYYVIHDEDEKEVLRKENEERNQNFSLEEEKTEEKNSFQESEDDFLKPFTLPKGIKFFGIYVAHQKAPLTEGQAFLYFFPAGHSEFAVIPLGEEEEGEKFLTLIVNPINGAVEIRDGYFEYEEIQEENED